MIKDSQYKCCLSGIPIKHGDEVLITWGVKKGNPYGNYKIVCPLIEGEFGDHSFLIKDKERIPSFFNDLLDGDHYYLCSKTKEIRNGRFLCFIVIHKELFNRHIGDWHQDYLGSHESFMSFFPRLLDLYKDSESLLWMDKMSEQEMNKIPKEQLDSARTHARLLFFKHLKTKLSIQNFCSIRTEAAQFWQRVFKSYYDIPEYILNPGDIKELGFKPLPDVDEWINQAMSILLSDHFDSFGMIEPVNWSNITALRFDEKLKRVMNVNKKFLIEKRGV